MPVFFDAEAAERFKNKPGHASFDKLARFLSNGDLDWGPSSDATTKLEEACGAMGLSFEAGHQTGKRRGVVLLHAAAKRTRAGNHVDHTAL